MSQRSGHNPPVDRIGRFELRGELGRGGMGVVLRAWDSLSGEEVAIKVLLSAASERSRGRFEREVESLTRLDHPNVVRVREHGEHRGQPYLVMDFVPGRSLDALLEERGTLPPAEAVELTLQLARALEHAHQRGVLHRDVKPANVLVDGRRALLTDFGLARPLDARTLSATGVGLGTPHYWPPEQALGKRDRVGPPSDVYALGGTLYSCLCGEPPFQGESFEELLLTTCREPARPPSEAGGPLDPVLDAIVLRCLAKEPDERWPSAAALIEALEAWQRGESPAPARSTRRSPPLAAGVVLACGVLCGGAALLAARSGEPAPAGEVAPSGEVAQRGPEPWPRALSEALAAAKGQPSELDAVLLALEDPALPRWDAAATHRLLRAAPGLGSLPVVYRLYWEDRLDDARYLADQAALADEPGGEVLSEALRVAAEGRAGFQQALSLNADMARSERPRPGPEGAQPGIRRVTRALQHARGLERDLGRLGRALYEEARAGAVAIRGEISGPYSEQPSAEEVHARLDAALALAREQAPRAYDRLRAVWERVGRYNEPFAPQPGELDPLRALEELRAVRGPGSVILRLLANCLLARQIDLEPLERLAAFRRARDLYVSHPNVRDDHRHSIGGASHAVGRVLLEIGWLARDEGRELPFDLERWLTLLRESGTPHHYVGALLLGGRLEELDRFAAGAPPGMGRVRCELQSLLARGDGQGALRHWEAQSQGLRQIFAIQHVHALHLLGRTQEALQFLDALPRPAEEIFPWHRRDRMRAVLAGKAWWPGKRN